MEPPTEEPLKDCILNILTFMRDPAVTPCRYQHSTQQLDAGPCSLQKLGPPVREQQEYARADVTSCPVLKVVSCREKDEPASLHLQGTQGQQARVEEKRMTYSLHRTAPDQ